jgi:Cytochrome domain of cellobiose dehydrogenase
MAVTVVGAVVQTCDSVSGVCVAFTIPANQTSSSNPDILATIQCPGKLGWVGFGFGRQMIGSLVFTMWPHNNQVIVSSRYA